MDGDGSSESSSIDEELDATRKDEPKYKQILTEQTDALVEGMTPIPVLEQLQRRKVFDRSDREEVLAVTTTKGKNDKIVDLLVRGRGEEGFVGFVASLRELHYTQLAELLVPVRYRILWCSSAASHAAVVVHMLETHANAEFQAVEVEEGLNCLSRRGVVFDGEDIYTVVEIHLVFPIDDKCVSGAMESAFSSVCPQADIVVMSGVCERIGEEVRGGDLILANEAIEKATNSQIKRSGPNPKFVETLCRHLQQLFAHNPPSWVADVSSLLAEHNTLQYETLWLARLHSELLRLRSGQKDSPWLAAIGWDQAQSSLLNRQNQEVLAKYLHDWESGKLVSLLLKAATKKTWCVDPSSPLGITPPACLVAAVEGHVATDSAFPVAVEQHPPSLVPRVGIVSSFVPKERETPCTPLAVDKDCYQFYIHCQEKLGMDKPWFLCKGVAYEGTNDAACTISSTCVLMEAVKLFLEQQIE